MFICWLKKIFLVIVYVIYIEVKVIIVLSLRVGGGVGFYVKGVGICVDKGFNF